MSPCSRYSSLQLINISRKIQEESQAHSLSGQDSISDKNVNDKNAEVFRWPGTMESNSIQSTKCCHWVKHNTWCTLSGAPSPVSCNIRHMQQHLSWRGYKISRQANLNCNHVIVLSRIDKREKSLLNNHKKNYFFGTPNPTYLSSHLILSPMIPRKHCVTGVFHFS